MTQRRWACLAVLIAAAQVAVAAMAPVSVSPGRADAVVSVESRCPTFSWSASDGAEDYELVVYRIGSEGEESRPYLNQRFKGSVSSWTPSLEQCLERGTRYAWSIRALGSGNDGEWSHPLLFQVTPEPTEDQFHEALAVVRQYLGATRNAELPTTSAEPSSGEPSAMPLNLVATEARVAQTIRAEADRLESDIATAGPESIGVAALSVEGEVRTTTSWGVPRLWGRGRPGTVRNGIGMGLCTSAEYVNVRFGLSTVAVDWGSAADACPAGTWVCTLAERSLVSCNTLRPNTDSDWRECDGTPNDLDACCHLGWVADSYPVNTKTDEGYAVWEGGGLNWLPTCNVLPVWCCSE